MSKLTLSIDKEVIKKAKELASKGNTNISKLFSNYIKLLAGKDESADRLGPSTRKITGILPQDIDYKQALEESLAQRYRDK
jgi:hypothetical protein